MHMSMMVVLLFMWPILVVQNYSKDVDVAAAPDDGGGNDENDDNNVGGIGDGGVGGNVGG